MASFPNFLLPTHSSGEKSLTARMKAARERLGLSQAQAARQWGFSQQTLNAWEIGLRNPAGLYRKKLERILRRVESEGD
jgi:DNA-binding transcriptional regulator YiaG